MARAGTASGPSGGGAWRRAGLRIVRSALGSLVLVSILLATLSIGGCMERMFYWPTREPTPPPLAFAGAERVEFPSNDGLTLVGWFIPATNGPSGAAAATVIHVHGNAGNINDHLYFSEFLPAAGFNLFIFDYRGYGESEGKARRRADLIADAGAALDAVLARDDVDPVRIGVFGHSLGGAIALNVAAEREEVRAVAVVSAFTGWREIAADSIGGGDGGPVARFFARVLIADGHRPIDAIAKIDRPILVIHGAADQIVPVRHGRSLAEAAPDARFHEIPGGRHNDLRDTNPEVDELLTAFFAAELDAAPLNRPGDEPPPSP